jgi:hypothetical protein
MANKTTQSRANRWRAGTPIYSRIGNRTRASDIGPMIGSDKDHLVSDMLADMCGLIVKTIALIPPERDGERLHACAFVLEEINEAVERIVNADRTEH